VIQNNNSNSNITSWTLPAGRGIHFAYVVVSNGSGGSTERRIAINTDSFGGDGDDNDAVAPPASTCTNPGVTGPTISNMTASLYGRILPSPIAQFAPPPTGLPSDIEPQNDVFLSAAGTDSWTSACQYYKAVGAVSAATDCSTGKFTQPITYWDWQKAVKIGRFATPGTPTFRAAFVNKVDLNLARVHQSISYGPDNTAAVVCNHLGTKKFFNPTQNDIDHAVLNAVENRNLVACVAMDDIPSINSESPFVRFLIFGPSGELLPSINLDGRAEKFVPGTCTVCHGGSNGTGHANINAHFLPYDVGNFEFANVPGLRKCDQQEAIYHLNQNVLKASPTQAETDLIGVAGASGWYQYPNNGQCSPHVTHVLDENYVPPSTLAFPNNWRSQSAAIQDTYRNFVARSCRTCHVAQPGFNWDDYSNLPRSLPSNPPGSAFPSYMCGTAAPPTLTMPNSLLTFNRFWLSHINTTAGPDQVQLLQTLSGQILTTSNCPVLAQPVANPNP
jgi:hypothetical protein